MSFRHQANREKYPKLRSPTPRERKLDQGFAMSVSKKRSRLIQELSADSSEHYFLCLNCKAVEVHDILNFSQAKPDEIVTDFLGDKYRIFRHCGKEMEELSDSSAYCPTCNKES